VVDVPKVTDAQWSETAVDRFLRNWGEHREVRPSPRADASTMLRRASLVLTGLAPTSELAEMYVRVAKNKVAEAYERLVDRLLESPRSWLGIRGIALHDVGETAKASLVCLKCLLDAEAPKSAEELAVRYARIAANVIESSLIGSCGPERFPITKSMLSLVWQSYSQATVKRSPAYSHH
jgi:Protein of unknown function (DUF1549)